MQLMWKNKKPVGFTLVEVLVIIPVIMLFIVSFITVIVRVTGDAIVTHRRNDIVYTANDSLNRIEQDVRFSNSFLAESSFTPVAPQGYNNDASPFRIEEDPGVILILSVYATNRSPNNQTRQLIFLADQPNSCDSSGVNSNPPLRLNIVYFVKDRSLFRRVILPQNTSGALSSAICDGTSSSTSAAKVWQLPTCDRNEVNGTTCRTEDDQPIENSLESYTVEYFESPNSTSPLESDSLSSATTVSVSLNLKRSAAGRDITHTATARATKFNFSE